MIAAVHGKGGAGGACDYVFERKKEEKAPTILGGTLAGRDGREVRAELEALTGLRPDVERGVFHGSLSAAPGEQPTPEQWAEMAGRWMERLKLDSYVVVQHHDAEHAHVHVLAARITPAGRVISDAYDALKSQEVAREIERDYQLEPVPSSWEKGAERAERGLTRAEAGRAERLGHDEPFLLAVRRSAGADFEAAKSWEDMTARLDRHGLRIEPGKRGPGLVVTDGQETIKASDVGRAFSRSNLEKRLGDHDRFVERSRERGTEREQQRERGDTARIAGRYAQERQPGVSLSGAGHGEGRAAGPDVGPGRGVDGRGAPAARGVEGHDRPGTAVVRGPDVGEGRGDGGRPGAAGGRERGDTDGGRGAESSRGRDHVADVGAGERADAATRPLGVGEAGRARGAADERRAAPDAGLGAGSGPGVPTPPRDDPGSVLDRGVHGVAPHRSDSVPAPAVGQRPEAVSPHRTSPAARQAAEAALRAAERQRTLHALADGARDEVGRAFVRLYEQPGPALARFDTMMNAVGAEIAIERLGSQPGIFGAPTALALTGERKGWGRTLPRAAAEAARGWLKAEAQRPAHSVAEVAAELTRARAVVEPFRAMDRAKGAVERALGLGRDRGGLGR